MIDFTPVFRPYARRRRAELLREDAPAEQEHQLRLLLARAADTRFGRDHGFSSIRTIADFQRAVPLRRYEAMWAEYWKAPFPVIDDVSWPGRIPFFAVTSGTATGVTKYIPVSREMNHANTRAGLDVLVHHLAHRPQSRALGGKSFMLGGSTALKEHAPGVHSGGLSGIAIRQVPWWLRPFNFPPPGIAAETDWEKKTDAIAQAAPAADIRTISGTPPWLLMLFERQRALSGKWGARALYPNLEMMVHGGVNFKPYRAQFEAFLEGRAELREVYPASEGFIALQDETPGDGLRLQCGNGLFFEFVPLEELDSASPVRHTVANAETGANYAIVLSTCAGCWAYVIGDTVRFLTRAPPRILITGRTSYFVSAVGEHLTGEEIEDAVTAAAAAIGIGATEFSMGTRFAERRGKADGHLYVVEFARHPLAGEEIARFAALLDARLCELNDDYRTCRLDASVLSPPEIMTVPKGTFAAWMKARGRLGGQNKIPRVINDPELFGELVAFAGR